MNFFKLFAFVFSASTLLVMSGEPAFAQFNPLDEACQDTPGSSVCQESDQQQNGDNPITGSDGLVTDIVSILAIVIGVAAVIMLIYGGFLLVSAGSNTEQQARGRRAVLYAIVGVAVAGLAWTIISFVTGRLL